MEEQPKEPTISALWIVPIVLLILIIAVVCIERLLVPPEKIASSESIIKRGTIKTADGKIIAQSVERGRNFDRFYAYGEMMSTITGYYSTLHGKTGLENSLDSTLRGNRDLSFLQYWLSRIRNDNPEGHSVILTIDSGVQAIALRALGRRRGAAIVMDAKSGELLALSSQPSFDPNDVDKAWNELLASPNQPLLNRATDSLYPPGSTFKIITSSAAIEKGNINEGSTFDGPAELKVHGYRVRNQGNKEYKQITLGSAFTYSVNTVFAQIGLRLGATRLVEAADAFGFNRQLLFALPLKVSTTPSPNRMDQGSTAWMAIGQGQVRATPLQMALVAATIANNGVMPSAHLVQKIIDNRGKLVQKAEIQPGKQIIKPETAKKIRDFMIDSVNKGTGRKARIKDQKVAGKTGTAELSGSKEPHAWFVGFAPADNPQIAVAVILENRGSGGIAAAPVARKIISETMKLRAK